MSEEPKVIKFRNYVPRNEELKKQAVESKPTPSVELSKELDVSSGPSSDASKVGGQSTGNFVASGGDQGDLGSFVGILSAPTTIDPVSIAPKKANWDLKRDVEKRLAKLERQTQTAIRELIRQKIAEEGNTEEEKDVAEAVATHGGEMDYESDS